MNKQGQLFHKKTVRNIHRECGTIFGFRGRQSTTKMLEANHMKFQQHPWKF